MPVLTVFGLPDSITRDELMRLCDTLKRSLASLKVLDIRPEDVTVLFPRDLLQEGLGEEIICFVDALADRPERTESVKLQLATEIRDDIELFKVTVPQVSRCQRIEVFVRQTPSATSVRSYGHTVRDGSCGD